MTQTEIASWNATIWYNDLWSRPNYRWICHPSLWTNHLVNSQGSVWCTTMINKFSTDETNNRPGSRYTNNTITPKQQRCCGITSSSFTGSRLYPSALGLTIGIVSPPSSIRGRWLVIPPFLSPSETMAGSLHPFCLYNSPFESFIYVCFVRPVLCNNPPNSLYTWACHYRGSIFITFPISVLFLRRGLQE